jgi:hypothetical protein
MHKNKIALKLPYMMVSGEIRHKAERSAARRCREWGSERVQTCTRRTYVELSRMVKTHEKI